MITSNNARTYRNLLQKVNVSDYTAEELELHTIAANCLEKLLDFYDEQKNGEKDSVYTVPYQGIEITLNQEEYDHAISLSDIDRSLFFDQFLHRGKIAYNKGKITYTNPFEPGDLQESDTEENSKKGKLSTISSTSSIPPEYNLPRWGDPVSPSYIELDKAISTAWDNMKKASSFITHKQANNI